ncbi:hypothetical protein AB0K25_19680 [Micromonospora sp. NPDC049257]|uniref:hypothetical protein n=1 Tax=Micromonospora sp. NPDC049257 TaxID=3155771 RepID=UPI00342CA843
MTITPLRVTGATGDPLAEAIELTKRLKLPHLRRAMADLAKSPHRTNRAIQDLHLSLYPTTRDIVHGLAA